MGGTGTIYIEAPAYFTVGMDRATLIKETGEQLARSGFYVSDPHLMRGQSFDIIARRDNTLLFVKVLGNVDAFPRATAEELKFVAMTLKGAPLVVGERAGSGKLESGVIYSRFDVPILAKDTLEEFLDTGVAPFLFAAPGGLYVRLDGSALQRVRKERELTLGQLAEIGGVSRRTIQLYMEGMSASADVAFRLEDFLDTPLILPVDPFLSTPEKAEMRTSLSGFERFERHIFEKLVNLGFQVLPTAHSPFEALATEPKDNGLYVTGVGTKGEDVGEKITVIASVSHVAEREFVVFIEKHRSGMRVRGLPVIDRQELKKVKDRDDLEELIEDRKG